MADPNHIGQPQQQQPPQHPSGFWTLTRPNKLSSKRRNSDLHELHHKIFNISVVGLSGVEKDKGPLGIGKSCLCNRFVRSAQDDYHTDHISCLSQSDFSGRVVNNDHWLYWGSVIKSCDGYDLAFNVIEQTEFVDDSCFQPFKTNKTEPYFKRCANTKLNSAEKLMYICKNQLGIEKEYEQKYLPDGKFNVDGFLCLFDVSEVHGRNVQKQIEMTNLILLNLMKTKKPVVFVTTKHDEANDLLLMEAERLINQRDFRGLIPLVETSAQDNININMAFLVCAQLIDKTRTKLRVPSYFEAYKNHQDLLNAASDAYIGLIQSTVIDINTSWQQVCIKLSHNPEFLQYTYLHGLDKATLVFKNHLKRLRDDCINLKVHHYIKLFQDVLDELVPKSSNLTIENNNPNLVKQFNCSIQSWEQTKEQIKTHMSFNKYFILMHPDISWYDTDLLQSSENRIPSDWLDSEEAYSVYQQRRMVIENEQRRQNTREIFAQMLTDIKIPVGKPFIELKHVFAGDPNFELLGDQELFEIYVEYQNNLLQKARADFQELLLENAEHLHHLTSSNKVIRQEDIKTINAILQHDERYHTLDRFDQDRTLMIIRHLSFLHSQISEQCPSHPKCVEPEIERLLITKAKTLVSRYFNTKQQNGKIPSHSKKTCDMIIFGPRRPSQQLMLALNVLNSRSPKESQYQITFTVFDTADELEDHVENFKQTSTKPKGCFGIFTNQRSLEHISYTMEKFLILTNQMQNDKNHFGSPPVVMLYAADITLDERTMLALETEGQQVADRFKCPFMNVTAIDQYRQHQQNNILKVNMEDSSGQMTSECASLDYACVDAAFNVLKEAVSRRVCFMELYNNQDLIPRQAFQPDARILMCLLCGEPFSNELFMWRMFLDYEDCYVTSSKSICLRIKLDGGQEKFVEVIITSYTHGAFNYSEDLLHGFILVCSIQRKASISILNAFSFNIPCTPVLVIAIKNNNLESCLNDQNIGDLCENELQLLIDDAKSAAKRLKGHFELLNLDSRENSDLVGLGSSGINKISNFLHNVIKRKPIIEKAYEIGENDTYPKELKADLTTSSPVQGTNSKATAGESYGLANSSFGPHHRVRINQRRQNVMASDDDVDDPQRRSIDKNLSDENDPYSKLLSQPQLDGSPKKSGREEPFHQSNLNELYATRPLPPIPASSASFEIQRRELNGTGNDRQETHRHFTGSKKSLNSNDGQEPSNNQELIASSTDDDTEDSTDNKADKPKPGKLDLSQFDNITNAIRKLNIQPPPKNPHLSKVSSASQQQDSKKADQQDQQGSRFFKNRTKKTKGTSKSSSTETPISSSISGNRRLMANNPRQNHGRAIAPPQLPPTLPGSGNGSMFSKSDLIIQRDDGDSMDAVKNETVKYLSGEAIDFNQSPIAHRLLQHSKNHKVSELNSPHDSDNESPVIKNPKLLRGLSSEGSNITTPTAANNSTTTTSTHPSIFANSSIDSSELTSSRGAAIRQLNEILANKGPPARFGLGSATANKMVNSRSSSLDQEQVQVNERKSDKDLKKDKKKHRDDEKMEKRRLKEEEKIRRQEKKLAAKKSKSGNSNGSICDDGIPLFIKRCIEFIELEGLDAEGIYRVPGNRAHVDAFVQKFKDNPDMSLLESDIPVNAVATALKDFLSKKWGPIIPTVLMNELTELSSISDRKERVEAVKQLVKKLPQPNFNLLKYVFAHFVRVSLNHSANSMDSKNLAICWWPTLLPLNFNDMVMFEQMRPHLEESIQTMIDQYDFIFDDEDTITKT